MGLIISKFKKQKTTIEILEEIEKNIATHQRFKRQNQEYQKKFIASLILYSIIIYVVATVIFFICYFPQSWKDWLFASIPLLLFPVLIWLVKKLMHWYFVKRISSNELTLQELRHKKKDMLEDVMENETYKKAKEILERFDPARFKKLETEKPAENKSGTVVRQRIVTTRTMAPVMRMPSTVRLESAHHAQQRIPNPSANPSMQMVSQMNGRQVSMVPPGYGRSPGPPMPRPVPPRERKTLDKFVDYLVGEGPQNRYALICRYCHSHNGMAMKEEFEYISFRCCYCYHLNPARKQRPHAPRLDFPTPQSSPVKRAIASPDAKSNEDKGSSEDDDVSTSSKKSEDETIATENDGNQADDDGTAVRVTKPVEEAAAAAEEESIEDADNIPMADDNGTKENTEEGAEINAEDGTAPNIEPDESVATGNTGEESFGIDNQSQEEMAMEPKEHKTASKTAVVSKFPTMEHTAPKIAAKESVVKTPDMSPQQIPGETTESTETTFPEIVKESSLSTDSTDEVPIFGELECLNIIDKSLQIQESPLTTTDSLAKEISVTTKTNTQQITRDIVMTAEDPTKEALINEEKFSEPVLMGKESQMTDEVSGYEMSYINKGTEMKDFPVAVQEAIEVSPVTVQIEDQQVAARIEAEDFSTVLDTMTKESLMSFEEALIATTPMSSKNDVLVAKETLLTTDTAVREDQMPSETDEKVLVAATGESLLNMKNNDLQVAKEAVFTADIVAKEDLISVEIDDQQTLVAATGEALICVKNDGLQVAEEALLTTNTSVREDLISEAIEEQASMAAAEEVLMSVKNDVLSFDKEALLTTDIASTKDLLSVETGDQQALATATEEAVMSVKNNDLSVAEEAMLTKDTEDLMSVVTDNQQTLMAATEEAVMSIKSDDLQVAEQVLLTTDIAAREDLISMETKLPKEASVTAGRATVEALMPLKSNDMITSDTATGEAQVSVETDDHQVPHEVLVTSDITAMDTLMPAETCAKQIAKENFPTTDTVAREALMSLATDFHQAWVAPETARMDALMSVKTCPQQITKENLMTADNIGLESFGFVKTDGQQGESEASISAEVVTIEALRSVKGKDQLTEKEVLGPSEAVTMEALRSVKGYNQQISEESLTTAEIATIEALKSVKSIDQQGEEKTLENFETATIEALRSVKAEDPQGAKTALGTAKTMTTEAITSMESDNPQMTEKSLLAAEIVTIEALKSVKTNKHVDQDAKVNI